MSNYPDDIFQTHQKADLHIDKSHNSKIAKSHSKAKANPNPNPNYNNTQVLTQPPTVAQTPISPSTIISTSTTTSITTSVMSPSTNTQMLTHSIGFYQLWRREWQVKQQGAVQWLYPLVLFLVIITLFPLAVGTEPQLLQRLGVPAVWIAALLALVMGVDTLFKPALENGSLAQLIVAQASLPTWVLVRLVIHWIFSCGMVALLSFLAVPLFQLSWGEALVLMTSIVVGSPMLLMLSAIASSLTVSLKNGAVLVPLIALPMQLPVLIFATGAVDLYATGMNGLPILALLLAASIVSVMVTPWVISITLKMAWLN